MSGLTVQAQTIDFDDPNVLTGYLGSYNNPGPAGASLKYVYPNVFDYWDGAFLGQDLEVADLDVPGASLAYRAYKQVLHVKLVTNTGVVRFGPLLSGNFGFVMLKSFYSIWPWGNPTTVGCVVTVLDANYNQVGNTETFQADNNNPIVVCIAQQQVPAGGYVTLNASPAPFYVDDILAAGGPVPVELTSFRSYLKDDRVDLRWTTATELNNYGFDVERSRDGETWTTMGFVLGHGTIFSPQEYSFTDNDLDRSATTGLYYRLKQMDRDGTTAYSPVLRVALPAAGTLELQAFPQPFADQLNIDIASDEGTFMTVQLFNSVMQEVARVYEGPVDGVMSLTIPTGNLRDGSYFLVVRKSNGESLLRKVLRVSAQ